MFSLMQHAYLVASINYFLFVFFISLFFHATRFNYQLKVYHCFYECFRGWTIGRGGGATILVRRLQARFSSFDRSYCCSKRRPEI